tara:strand:- start:116 stop:655 length:540 start_codon:yes stop_codon:yes gene_type:complete
LKTISKWLVKLLQVLLDLLEKKEKESTQKMQVEDKMPTKKSIEVKGVNLLIIRETYTDKSTIGKLFVNGEYFCYTLELPYRDNQRRISCIPSGEYKVRLRLARESATRDYLHLLVQDVPDRTYILFHRGNRPSHTKGCILVGQTYEQDFVGNSTLAMDLLMKEIINLGGENINLIIKNQ